MIIGAFVFVFYVDIHAELGWHIGPLGGSVSVHGLLMVLD